MKTVEFAFILLFTLAASSNNGQSQNVESAIVEGNNKFAFALYDRLREEKGNLFFSPYSISTALAITYAGARGETQAQMAKVLCFPAIMSDANQTQFHKAFGQIIKDINVRGSKDAYELTVANALWGQKGYSFLKEYLSLIETNYGGGFNEVDFANSEEARQTINKWVENKTRNKIKDMIATDILDGNIRLVLTNAIYFKSKWANQFSKEITQNEPFTLLNGKKIDVPMMRQSEHFGYMESEDLHILEMPYSEEQLSMIILLPKKNDGLPDIEKKLTDLNLSNWLNMLGKGSVAVSIPRFKIGRHFRLEKIFQSMGMVDAFQSGKADFPGMDGSRDLFISFIIHKTFIDVNEEGTEATVGTGGGIKFLGTFAVFKADHPFIFLIRDNKTGSILFLGRVLNPISSDKD